MKQCLNVLGKMTAAALLCFSLTGPLSVNAADLEVQMVSPDLENTDWEDAENVLELRQISVSFSDTWANRSSETDLYLIADMDVVSLAAEEILLTEEIKGIELISLDDGTTYSPAFYLPKAELLPDETVQGQIVARIENQTEEELSQERFRIRVIMEHGDWEEILLNEAGLEETARDLDLQMSEKKELPDVMETEPETGLEAVTEKVTEEETEEDTVYESRILEQPMSAQVIRQAKLRSIPASYGYQTLYILEPQETVTILEILEGTAGSDEWLKISVNGMEGYLLKKNVESEELWQTGVRSLTAPETEAETRPWPETEAETEPWPWPETEAETEPWPWPETETETQVFTWPETETETEPAAWPETEAGTEPFTWPETEAETEPPALPETETEAASGAVSADIPGFNQYPWNTEYEVILQEIQNDPKLSERDYLTEEDAYILVFGSSTVAGFSTEIFYEFTDGLLTNGSYWLTEEHEDTYDYYADFESLGRKLELVYGQPGESEAVWYDERYRNDPSAWGTAAIEEDVFFYRLWEDSEGNSIYLYFSGDEGEPSIVILYSAAEKEEVVEESENVQGL